jgi:EAL domain-containing protein (putative c-di-GMP-specific phosphodiesterase class I)
MEILIEEGCDEMQGFLIGRPLPVEAYANLLNRDDAVARA